MKPLDLTKPVQYRNGDAAKIIYSEARFDYRGIKQPIVSEHPSGSLYHHNLDGSFHSSSMPNHLDLINTPEKRTVEFWMNVYPSHVGAGFTAKSVADTVGSARIACLHIVREFTVGEGL